MSRVFGFTEYGDASMQDTWDREVPEPGPSELLVAVHAAGVNPFDVKVREGALRDAMEMAFPAGLGTEVAGVVEAVGIDVEGFSVGDEVLGSVRPGAGGIAEHALVGMHEAAAKHTAVSFTDAATLPVAAATALDAVHQLDLQAGQTLLVTGVGGGVGVAVAQLARLHDVMVVGTGSESKRDLVESLGAVLVVYGDGVADRVREILPDGVDGIIDLVGGNALRDVAGTAKNPAMIISAVDPDAVATLGGAEFVRRGLDETLPELVALVADGKLNPHVNDIVPFDDAASAIAAVETGHSQGKVVIQVV